MLCDVISSHFFTYVYCLFSFESLSYTSQIEKHNDGTFLFRIKVGDMGAQQAEPRLERKKHRRQSRKRLNQSILNELDELEDEDDSLDEEDPILRAMRNENQ